MELSKHDREVLQRLEGAAWMTQYALKTSRQTMNKLVRGKLVEKKVGESAIRYLPESGSVYRLRN